MSHSERPVPGSGEPSVRLTRRGRVVLGVAVALLLVLLFGALRSCSRTQSSSAVPAPVLAPAAGTPSASASQTAASSTSSSGSGPASTTSASSPSPSASRTSIMDGIVHSGDKGSGTWNLASLSTPTTHPGRARAHHYVVKVETNLHLDADDVARQAQATLDDDRSWVGSTANSFSLVNDPAKADLTIFLASPDTTEAMCKPLDVLQTWSCNHGGTVVLNADRWRYRTPTWQAAGLAEYRAYMVNHEVGHFIGRGHLACPGAGEVAPVMMQQSIRLDGCTINAWPAGSNGR